MPQQEIQFNAPYLWNQFRGWWNGLRIWIRGVLAVAAVLAVGSLIAALAPDGTPIIPPNALNNGELSIQPSSGTFPLGSTMTIELRVGNPSGQNIGGVTAVLTFDPALLAMTSQDCLTATDNACINTINSDFSEKLIHSVVGNTITISRGVGGTGWYMGTDGVLASLRFRTLATAGVTDIAINEAASAIGVPISTGVNTCSEGINSGNPCAGAGNPDCPMWDINALQCTNNPPPVAQAVERGISLIPAAEAALAQIGGLGRCQPPSTVTGTCATRNDCQQFALCLPTFSSQNILAVGGVSGGTYTIGGLSCTTPPPAGFGGFICGSNQRTCSNDPTKTCTNNTGCPLYVVGVTARCKTGVGVRTCENNITIQCTDDFECQEYGVCQVGSNLVCLGIEHQDTDSATVCCSQDCTAAQAGQLYIQNVTAATVASAGGSATEAISWVVVPPSAGRSICNTTVSGGGAQQSNAVGNHSVSIPISGVTAGAQYTYQISCTAPGYTVGVYNGSFTIGQAGGGALRIMGLAAGNVSSSSAQISYSTSVNASGSVSVQRVSCSVPGFPSYSGSGSDAGGVTSHRHDISFPAYAGSCTYSVTVTASAAGQTATATTQFTSSAQTAQTPNANVIMKVTKDRACKNWVYCMSGVRMKNQDGRQEDLCFDLGTCDTLDANGQCINPAGGGGGELTFPHAQVSAIKEMSGLVKAGISWGGQTSVRGYYPYRGMYEIGRVVKIQNGSLESGQPSPWRPVNRATIYNFRNTADGNNPSYILKIVPNNASWSGASVPLGTLFPSTEPFMLSFRGRTDGSSATGKPINVQLGTGTAPNYSFADFARLTGSGPITLTSSWQRFQLTLGSAGAGGNTMLQFVQPPGSGSDAFYVDDVAIQPVLKARDDLYISRSCRLYPKADAPACDFLEIASGKEFVGWKGYCVERQDPNPALANDPSNECLLWWPVDVLAGSADLFAGEAVAGYKGRKPLYYCLESKGDWPYFDRIASAGLDSGQTEGVTWPIDVANLDIHRDEISEVRINGIRIDHDGDSTGDCELYVENSGVNQAVAGGNNGTISFNSSNREHWTDAVDSSSLSCGGGYSASFNPYGWLRCANRGRENDCNIMTGRLVFSNQGMLQQIVVKFHDGSGGRGKGNVESVTITYRGERCNVVAQVVTPDGESMPWAARISPGGWSINNNAKYPYNQDFEPYGGVVPPGGANVDTGDPVTWESPAYVEAPLTTGFLTRPYQYRAGAPYGLKFVSNVLPTTGGRVCITGSDDRLGKSCAQDASCGFVVSGGSNTTPGICAGIEKPPDNIITWPQLYQNLAGGAARGRSNIGNLFIRSFGVWKWGYDGVEKYRYIKCVDVDNPVAGCVPDWDFTSCSGANAPIPGCGGNNAVDAPRVTEIQIDAPPVIKGSGGVTLRFTTAVNGNHLPLVGFRIDWNGNGSDITEVGGLRINPRSSMEDPHVAVHTYTSPGTYTPRIQVLDNWGWCNGTLGSANGFYGPACSGSGAWASSPVQVTVVP